MRVLLGVTGGIAAYKVATVVRRLREDGHDVRVVPTEASLAFVGRATWEALTGQPATTSTFSNIPSVEHIRLGQRADVVVVAPATADFLAGMAAGTAKDLLGNAILATKAPVLVAPAMHTEMWLNAATQANVATLRDRGVAILEPAVGRLTGADSGPGRLPEPEHIVAAIYSVAAGHGVPVAPEAADARPAAPWGDLNGVNILVTAGGTREPIDAVRFLGNYSTGLQGFAIAEAARERGATVEVVAANVELALGEGISRTDVSTGEDFARVVKAKAAAADVVVMAAAVADFRPVKTHETKIKKSEQTLTLELTQTEDILASLVALRGAGASPAGQVLVGFAAETGDDEASVEEHGRAKAIRKGANLLVINPVGGGKGFGAPTNAVTIVDSHGDSVAKGAGSKLEIAGLILDLVAQRLGAKQP